MSLMRVLMSDWTDFNVIFCVCLSGYLDDHLDSHGTEILRITKDIFGA